MAQIIASGTTDATSSDIVVTSPVTISLFWSATPPLPKCAIARIDVKGSNGAYMELGMVTQTLPAVSIVAPGTYRVRRVAADNPADAIAFGVDQT